jgi:hypothetical protein
LFGQHAFHALACLVVTGVQGGCGGWVVVVRGCEGGASWIAPGRWIAVFLFLQLSEAGDGAPGAYSILKICRVEYVDIAIHPA